MKYVVVYRLDHNSNALAFPSKDEAIDYINECNELGDDYIRKISDDGSDKYTVTFRNENEMVIYIKEFKDKNVKFDLILLKNDEYVETRRFSKRELAVEFAHKILDENGFIEDEIEDEKGYWEGNDSDTGVKIEIALNLVILGESEKTEYDTLNIKPNASEEEIKKAFLSFALVKYN